jgi:hypothetical protein
MFKISLQLYQDYIHKVPVVLHDNLQREYHQHYGPPTSVTWLHLLRKQTNTGTSTALTAETHWIYAHTISLTLLICDASLGLPASEAGHFVQLNMLYIWEF